MEMQLKPAFLPGQPVEVSPTEALERHIAGLERHGGRRLLMYALANKLAVPCDLSFAPP